MKLLVIEGLDGAGKSTQIKMIRDFLTDSGFKCEFIHFPRTDSPWFGELIARFLRGEFGSLNEVDPYLVAMLYAGDRKDVAPAIADWLRKGSIVILDRYTYSNIAYQCAKLQNPAEQEKLRKWILELEFSHFAIPKPDLNIFLDVPLGFVQNKLTSNREGDDRRYLNGQNDIHENSISFQMKVRDVYLKVAETDERMAVVDCSSGGNMLPPGEIFKVILNLLYERKLLQ